MIEVIAALGVAATIMLLGSVIGPRYVARQRETAALVRLQTEWRALQNASETQHVGVAMTFDRNAQVCTFRQDGEIISQLAFPESLRIISSARIARNADQNFTTPRVIFLGSTMGGEYRLSFGMGWGQLTVKRHVSAAS